MSTCIPIFKMFHQPRSWTCMDLPDRLTCRAAVARAAALKRLHYRSVDLLWRRRAKSVSLRVPQGKVRGRRGASRPFPLCAFTSPCVTDSGVSNESARVRCDVRRLRYTFSTLGGESDQLLKPSGENGCQKVNGNRSMVSLTPSHRRNM